MYGQLQKRGPWCGQSLFVVNGGRVDTDGPQAQAGRIMPKALVIALVAVLVGGCAVWDEYVRLVNAPYTGPPYSVTWDAETGRSIRTYHYGQRDPLGSVHRYRPDIYHGFYGPHGARP